MVGRAFILLIAVPLILGVIIYGIVRLQLFLSRTHSRWPGLILPGLVLLPSFIILFTILGTQTVSHFTTTGTRQDITGTAYTVVHHLVDYGTIGGGFLFVAVPLFLLTNIPTVILLAIYAICRDKMQKQAEMNRMNVQDL